MKSNLERFHAVILKSTCCWKLQLDCHSADSPKAPARSFFFLTLLVSLFGDVGAFLDLFVVFLCTFNMSS